MGVSAFGLGSGGRARSRFGTGPGDGRTAGPRRAMGRGSRAHHAGGGAGARREAGAGEQRRSARWVGVGTGGGPSGRGAGVAGVGAGPRAAPPDAARRAVPPPLGSVGRAARARAPAPAAMSERYQRTFAIPEEFPALLKDFTREILRTQPDNLYEYGARYFSELVDARAAAEAEAAEAEAAGEEGDGERDVLMMDDNELQEYVQELFMEADTDNSGTLDHKELKVSSDGGRGPTTLGAAAGAVPPQSRTLASGDRSTRLLRARALTRACARRALPRVCRVS